MTPNNRVFRRYLDSASLVGNIRRLSSKPLAAADLTLPAPGDAGSLSDNADIVVDAANQVGVGLLAVLYKLHGRGLVLRLKSVPEG